jgi:hypothetical protein
MYENKCKSEDESKEKGHEKVNKKSMTGKT